MRRYFAQFALWFLMFSGCHCCQISERYGDRVDRFADRKLVLDRLYCERLDLTRICWGCKIQGKHYCPPVAVYPESKVQQLPATAPLEPTAPMETPTPKELPVIPAPPVIPPVELHPEPVAPAPPAEREVSVKVIPITIDGDVQDLTPEQLAALLKQVQSEIRQSSGTVVQPAAQAIHLEPTASSSVPKKSASQVISAPAGVPPAPRSASR